MSDKREVIDIAEAARFRDGLERQLGYSLTEIEVLAVALHERDAAVKIASQLGEDLESVRAELDRTANHRDQVSKMLSEVEKQLTLMTAARKATDDANTKLKEDLKKLANDWRGEAAAVDHPMRLQSPSWPIQCAGEVEALVEDD